MDEDGFGERIFGSSEGEGGSLPEDGEVGIELELDMVLCL